MKKILSTLVLSLVATVMLLAQAPQTFSYQTVVRDNNWQVIQNQSIGVQVSIIEDVANGSVVYAEEHTATTNDIGLINLAVGGGTVATGLFSNIDWGNHSYFMKISVDVSGGTSYIVMGTTQLRSVPYALYAETSGSSTPGPQGVQGIQGLPGDTGAVGPQGPQGPIGLTGPAGNDGADGNDGIDGVDGAVGAQGPIGLTGPQGIQGVAGNDGVDGTNGLDGLNGLDGVQGIQGLPGDTGVTGPQGIQGVAGNDGADGTNGIDGTNGVDGIDGIDAVVDYDSLANLISVDSTFITTIGGGIGGGDCDYSFPEGLDGESITMLVNNSSGYTVPLGKRLYILNYNSAEPYINGMFFNFPNDNPLILNSGDVLTSISSGYMNGYLVNENQGLEALTMLTNNSSGYTVPLGKRLYILNYNSAEPYINGMFFNYPDGNPLILNAGDILTSSNGRMNGYLVDENYFAGCGGGGSSSTSNSSNSLVSLPVIYPDSTGINASPTSNYSYGDMVMNYSDGSVLVLAPGLDNNNLDYLFTSMATCGSASTSNQEHYISFQVTDTIIVKEKFQVLNYNSCSTPTGYLPLIYRHTNTVNFDPNIDGIGSSTGTNMLFPGFTYSMRCRVYMTNMGSAVHNFKIGYVSQFTVNPFFTNVSYFQQNYSDATFYTSTQFPVLQDLGFSFSLPIPVWIGL